MMTIWKFTLEITDRQIISMPAGAKILSLQLQSGVPCLWALVDPFAQNEIRTFRTYGTGHRVDETGTFIGTYQIDTLVFHVFEV